MSFFFFVQWRKKRERIEMVKVVVRLLSFGSLIGANHQSLRLACGKASIFMIRLCYQKGWVRLPL